MITILAVGKKHEAWIEDGVMRYHKRLRAPWNVEWVLLPHSTLDGSRAREEESGRILGRVDPSDYVILLDERGKLLDSPTLSKRIDQLFTDSHHVVLVIGGAYGVNEQLTNRANLVWSLSPLVFPHQLVRLILIEQLYRAQEIAAGRAYHHE